MVEQIDAAIGFYAEKFIGSEMSVEIRAFESTSSIEIEFFARQALDYPLILECMFNEESIVELCVSEPGTYSFKRNLHLSSGSTGVLTLKASNVKSGQQEGTNLDDREFSVLIKKIIFRN
jgi:hypothetical protein